MFIIKPVVLFVIGVFVGYKIKLAFLMFKKEKAEKEAMEAMRKNREDWETAEQAAREEEAKIKQEKRQSEEKVIWGRFFSDPEEYKKALAQFIDQVCSEKGKKIESLREEAFHMQFSLDDFRAAEALANIENEAYRRLRRSVPELDRQLSELEEKWKKEG
jgi:hypothetical protein